MDIAELCDPVTVRILLYILREGQANVTRISRELGIHHRVVRRHAEKLARAGVIVERRYMRLHIYMANLKDPRVAALKSLLEELEGVARSLGGGDG